MRRRSSGGWPVTTLLMRSIPPRPPLHHASSVAAWCIHPSVVTPVSARPAPRSSESNAVSSAKRNAGGPAGTSAGGWAPAAAMASKNVPLIRERAGSSHHVRASRPPGASTRPSSLAASSGRAKWPMPKLQTTASNAQSVNGSASASASRKRTSTCARAASASISTERSTPVTRAPRRAAAAATWPGPQATSSTARPARTRSEEHTSELQSPYDLVCRLLLEKKKKKKIHYLNDLQKKKQKELTK